MREIPEAMDLEKMARACDHVMAYMRSHYLDEPTLQAMSLLCAFVHRMKGQVEWMERQKEVIDLLIESAKQARSGTNG